MMEYSGTPPTGAELIATLVRLLEEQEGVKITYELERIEDNGKDYHSQDEQ